MNKRLKKLAYLLRDCVYPWLQPLSEETAERASKLADEERAKYAEQIEALSDEKDLLGEYLDGCTKLLDEAAETRRSVEARLTSTIGLSSIAGTLVFGGILALATGALHANNVPLRFLTAIGALYLVLQICCAILASIRGLERRTHIAMRFSDVLPSPGEGHLDYVRRQMGFCALRLDDYRSRTNDKVSYMAVAHRAMTNFVAGLIVLAVLGTCFAVQSKGGSDGIVETLRKDHALYEMLRGPQGPQGPKGDPGPPGQSPAPAKKQQRRSPVKP